MRAAYATTGQVAQRSDEPAALGRLVAVAPLALPAAAVVGITIGAWRAREEIATVTACGLAIALVVLASAVLRRMPGAGLLVGLTVLGAVVGERSWSAVDSVATGPVDTRAVVMADPVERGGSVEIVLEVEGERFTVWARGSPARRLRPAAMGDTVRIIGERTRPDDLPNWLRSRHVVGRLDVERVGSVRPGAPAFRAANRVRDQLEHGGRTLPEADRALFTGLVYGDDRAVSSDTVDAFRAAGLSHLTAVSGQNVAYLLAAASPLLRRLPPWGRWSMTVALIAWFALLTRFEPSVLRASVMAGVAATAFVTGRERSGIGILSVALTGLVLIDPMLVWSVGLWLSAAATAGLALLASPIERVLPGPRWLARLGAAAIAAQAGVLPVSGAVFGIPSIISLPANVLAVPVAGLVMLIGFPLALVASVLPDSLAAVVQLPCLIGVRWVAGLAHLGADLAPSAAVSAVMWALLGLVLAVRLRRRRTRQTTELGGDDVARSAMLH
jgi:competence protein ComEC